MHETCKNCKALAVISRTFVCVLGFQFENTKLIPLEPCPKPGTYLKLALFARFVANQAFDRKLAIFNGHEMLEKH